MDLEEKINTIRMRIINFRNKYKYIFENRTELDTAIFIFNKDDPHFIRNNL